MNIYARILKQLDTPDDQGNDWYAWASNQMSHALLGVIVGLYFPNAAVQVAAILALLKEATDIVRIPTIGTFRDSVVDVAFWLIGAWIASAGEYLSVSVIILFFALIIGIVPRARKAVFDA